MATPVLSVLIPAFEYAAGIARILERKTQGTDNVEYIIHDDSPDDTIAELVARYDDANIVYKRNQQTGDAVKNWNSLLDAARGTYVVLVHHDEFPASFGMFEAFASTVEHRDSGNADIYLCGLWRQHKRVPVLTKLIPNRVRLWLLQNHPHYLDRRNFIGPSATMIMRRNICPRFDEKLTWLVDVDFYRRIRTNADKIAGAGDVNIVSEINRAQSITKGISSQIDTIRKQDEAHIAQRDGKPASQPALFLSRIAEHIIWYAARLAGALNMKGRIGG